MVSNRGMTFPPEILTPDEVKRLIRAASNRAPTGIRNRALIVVMYRTGLRVSEALASVRRMLTVPEAQSAFCTARETRRGPWASTQRPAPLSSAGSTDALRGASTVGLRSSARSRGTHSIRRTCAPSCADWRSGPGSRSESTRMHCGTHTLRSLPERASR